jgi:sugar-phosphatase
MRAVLFDVDGVLLDSYAGYREVWSSWCAARDVDLELAWAATHGRKPVETVAEVAAHLDPEAEYVFLKQLLAAVGERFPAFPSAPALLHALPLARWGVVTSGERQTVLRRFRLAGVPEPQVLVDGEDVSRGKPSPQGYLLAAERLDIEPSACLVVEDAPAGIAAGKAAGMTVLALATTHALADLGSADWHSPSLAEAEEVIRAWAAGP